jgi:hypothetical protein
MKFFITQLYCITHRSIDTFRCREHTWPSSSIHHGSMSFFCDNSVNSKRSDHYRSMDATDRDESPQATWLCCPVSGLIQSYTCTITVYARLRGQSCHLAAHRSGPLESVRADYVLLANHGRMIGWSFDYFNLKFDHLSYLKIVQIKYYILGLFYGGPHHQHVTIFGKGK